MADNSARAQSLYDAWEKRDFDSFAKQFADGVSFNDVPRGEIVTGNDNVRDWYASWATAFPDSTAGATVMAASGDTVAIEGLLVGTNTGDFGPVPPTGRSISVPWANFLRFDAEGRVIGGTAYYDQLSLMIQLGLMQPPAAT